MKTVFKFTFFVLLGISVLGFVITAFVYIFAPDDAELVESSKQMESVADSAPIEVSDQETASTEELIEPEPETPSEQEPTAAGEKGETPLPPAGQQISWDLTPAEQDLSVGDWISIAGYQDVPIGATVEKYAATRVLKWNEPSALYGTNGMVDIASQATGLPAPSDRIVSVLGLVENPRENEMAVQVNKALLREQTVLIRATGQIDRIGGDKSPNRWIVFLKKGVHVDFVAE